MDLVDNLYRRLLAAVDAAGPDAFPDGITVADVYHRLIPFRAVREHLGIEDLAEYEHALLRLLAGKGRYVEVDDPSMRLEIQRELASLNPILGIYQDYSTARIRLDPDAASASRSAAAGETNARMPEGRGRPFAVEAAPAADGSAGLDRRLSPAAADATKVVGPQTSPDTGASPPMAPRLEESTAAILHCADCRRALPAISELRYCPFCGAGRLLLPCARCGGGMERDWRFCPRCGAAGGTPASTV